MALEQSVRTARSRQSHAQAYVEYGLLVAVVVIAFIVGLNFVMAGATTHLANAEPTPNATVLAGLPNHVVAINIVCSPLAPPNYTGVAINCSLTVKDITTIEPATLPKGTMQFTSSPVGTFNPNPCTLSGSGVTSGCTFTYTPTDTRQQDLTATYVPTSNHKSQSKTLAGVVWAVDQTQTQLMCLNPSVPVGEPSQCDVGVLDLYPARRAFLPTVNVVVTAARSGGSFSPLGVLAPRGPAYNCVTDASGACGTLFRSAASGAPDEGAYTINAVFDAAAQGDQDHDSSTATPGVVVTVGGPTLHPVTVALSCDGGGGLGQTPTSALQINLGASSRCTPTVIDTKPNDSNNNPTGITPTGSMSWTKSPGSGGAGNLSSATCNLTNVISDTTAQCVPLTYTPTSVGTPPGPNYVGDHSISAVYSSDWIHPTTGVSQTTDVYVEDQHIVQVSIQPCSNGTDRLFPLLIAGASADTTQCTATVTDTAPNKQTPTGTLTWSLAGTDGTGAFSPVTCTLGPAGPLGTAACAGPVTYQPMSRGTPDGPDQKSTHMLTATYSGDWLHPPMGGDQIQATPVFVGNLHIVNMTVSCAPPTTRTAPLHVSLAQTTACTVTVVDPGPSPATPTGSVGWSYSSIGNGGVGTLTPSAPCTLQAAGPVGTAKCPAVETYQPTARGAPDGLGPDTDNTHNVTATYSGDGLHPPPGGVDQTFTSPVYVDN